MSSPVEKIKEKLDIVELIGSYIKLEKAGSNYKATCPFHNEKTPSFLVSPSRGSFYCFGCGAKGDIFSFVEQFEGVDFSGALKSLSQRAGVPLIREDPKKRDEREKLSNALIEALEFFKEKLAQNEKAKEYLKKRGLQEKTIEDFSLGYVPNKWNGLRDHLSSKGFSNDEMLKSCLIKTKKEGSSSKEDYYDVFRGRIMFPISDNVGRVIAFSGRAFDDPDDPAKYINTPETALFHKSDVLYGYDKAKHYIRQKDFCVLVEGQMDLLMCHQAGYKNTVALSGTALTHQHLELVCRLSKRLVIAFDADGAGLRAALRGVGGALALGMDVKLASLPEGDDPASIISKDKNLWVETVKNSKHIVDFLLDSIKNEKYDERKFKLEVEKKVLPYISQIESGIDQAHFVSKVASSIGVNEDIIWQGVMSAEPLGTHEEKKGENSPPPPISGGRENIKEDKISVIERKILGILIWQESMDAPQIDTQKIRDHFREISCREINESLLEVGSKDYIFEAELFYKDNDLLQKELAELFVNFEENFIKKKLEELATNLKKTEKEGDEEKAKELLSNYQELSKRLNIFKQI